MGHRCKDHGGADISCMSPLTPDQCKQKCDENPNCKVFNLWNPLSRQGCCIKTDGNVTGDNNNCDFYQKK